MTDYILTFTAPESLAGVNGPEHSTVALNGIVFADIFNVDDAYVIERNGLQMEPVTRDIAIAMLNTLAMGYLAHVDEQASAAFEEAHRPFENPFDLI